MYTSPYSGAIMIVLSSNGWQAILLLRLCIQSCTRVAEYHGPHGWGEEDVEQSISPTLPSISSSLHEGEKYNPFLQENWYSAFLISVLTLQSLNTVPQTISDRLCLPIVSIWLFIHSFVVAFTNFQLLYSYTSKNKDDLIGTLADDHAISGLQFSYTMVFISCLLATYHL